MSQLRNLVFERLLCTFAATLALLLPPLSASAQADPSRLQALAALEQSDADARLAAIENLASTGTMEDSERLVRELRDEDEAVHSHAEAALSEIWSRSGDHGIDMLFQQGLDQLGSGNLELALATFQQVVVRKPDFAEGWNKRATVWFLLGRSEQSLNDCGETLKRNHLHYGAMTGAALIHLRLGNLEGASGYLARALQVHPHLAGARELQALIDAYLHRAAGKFDA